MQFQSLPLNQPFLSNGSVIYYKQNEERAFYGSEPGYAFQPLEIVKLINFNKPCKTKDGRHSGSMRQKRHTCVKCGEKFTIQ